MMVELIPYPRRIWETHHAALVQQVRLRKKAFDGRIYHYIHVSCLQASANDVQSMSASLDHATLAIKILRKAIVHGLKKPHEHQESMVFLSQLLDQIKVTLEMRKNMCVV